MFPMYLCYVVWVDLTWRKIKWYIQSQLQHEILSNSPKMLDHLMEKRLSYQ